MYKELIKKWIPNITPTIIKEYGEKIGIKLKDSETTILYQFIKKIIAKFWMEMKIVLKN